MSNAVAVPFQWDAADTKKWYASVNAKNEGRLCNILEVWDWDNTIADTVSGTANAAVVGLLGRRLNGVRAARSITMNLLFPAHELLGLKRGEIESETLNGVKLYENSIEVMKQHSRMGATQMVLTGNPNVERIGEKLRERGIDVQVVFCDASDKHKFVKKLIYENPDKRAEHINDSLVELGRAFLYRQKEHFILVRRDQNTIFASLLGRFGFVRVADLESPDSLDRAITGTRRDTA